MGFRIHSLTPDFWPAFEDLFRKHGASNGCWCMYWRIGADYQKAARGEEAEFCALVQSGPPPGLLAFEGDLAVGSCQLTPRDALPWLNQDRRLKRVDDLPVWSPSCFYIRRGWRRRGVTSALIAAALDAVKRAGAPALEAYPLDAGVARGEGFTGFTSTFKRAGFRVVGQHAPGRPIMRFDIRS